MCGPSIVGFGEYAYEYKSGRKGTAPAAGFSPRKAATVVYILDGLAAYSKLLAKLGPHKTGVGCLYIMDLEEIDLNVLRRVVRASFNTLTAGTYGKRAREATSSSTSSKKTSAKKATAKKAAAASGTAPNKPRVFSMSFASVYPLYVQKAEKKGRTLVEVDAVIGWLTGYCGKRLQRAIDDKVDLEAFFAQAPRWNPNAGLITGVVCGVRVEDVDDPLMQKIRYLDKLVDELAKGKKMASILRQ